MVKIDRRSEVMNSQRRQRGAGFIGLVFILVGLTIIGMLGVKLGPMFVDNMTINEVLRQVASDPDTKNMSIKSLRSALEKRLLVNGLDQYAKQAAFIKDEGIVYITLDYERRDTLWGNVDVVGVFENSAEVRSDN